MPLDFGNLSYGKNTREFIASPIDDIAKANKTLYDRASTNDSAMLQLEEFGNNIKVMEKDQENKTEALNTLKSDFIDVANKDSYAYAGKSIRRTAANFNSDLNLKESIKQKADYDATLAQAAKDGVDADRLNKWKSHWQASGERINVDPDTGVVDGYQTYRPLSKTPNVQKKVNDLLSKFKANKQPMEDGFGNIYTYMNGEWFVTGEETSVSEDRVYSAAYTMLENDPEINAYFNELTELDRYSKLAVNPSDGKYIYDNNGAPVEGTVEILANGTPVITPINYVNELNGIGLNEYLIDEFIGDYNRRNGTTYSMDDEGFPKLLYDANYRSALSTTYANQAMTIGAHNELTLNYKSSSAYLNKQAHARNVQLQKLKNQGRRNGSSSSSGSGSKVNKKPTVSYAYPDWASNQQGIGKKANDITDVAAHNKMVKQEYQTAHRENKEQYANITAAVNTQFEFIPIGKQQLENSYSPVWETQKVDFTNAAGVTKQVPVAGTLSLKWEKNGVIVELPNQTIIDSNNVSHDLTNAEINSALISQLDDDTYNSLVTQQRIKDQFDVQENAAIAAMPIEYKTTALSKIYSAINRGDLPNIGTSRGDLSSIVPNSNDAATVYNSISGHTDIIDKILSIDEYREFVIANSVEDTDPIYQELVMNANFNSTERGDINNKVMDILPNYYRAKQSAYAVEDLKVWTPPKKDVTTIKNYAVKQFASYSNGNDRFNLITTKGKSFKSMGVDEFVKASGIDPNHMWYDEVVKFYNEHSPMDISKFMGANLTDKQLYIGFSGTGRSTGSLINSFINIPVSKADPSNTNEPITSTVKAYLPALYFDLPADYSVEPNGLVEAQVNAVATQLAQSPSKTVAINMNTMLGKPYDPEQSVVFKNLSTDGVAQWMAYDPSGKPLASQPTQLNLLLKNYINFINN